MEPPRTTPGLVSEAGMSSNLHTPPYTPHRGKGKRTRVERSDSPASSIHPAETESPAKKAAKRAPFVLAEGADEIKVEELVEGDVGYMTDIDVVYPEELEEAGSSSDEHGADDELSAGDDDLRDDELPEAGLTRRLSKLHCNDAEGEARFEVGRRQRRMSKRLASRNVFKRTHIQSATKSETEEGGTEADVIDDHDLPASRRRLRRRVEGPRETEGPVGDAPRSSPETGSFRTASAGSLRVGLTKTPDREARDVTVSHNDDAMDVDDGG
ncbi:hypothetical protein BAUCODRAFT_493774 [Baudoinia panamericana UAMH 10762]|uniref:Uncharacterized protein n=1 Tax=Baudoinia panamericana (strain UAMH 10762) TaxID=717646 RepID=M2LML5_BAUPA|nr:uncharacterized protein BAUCODRAFT_493774 [Baudoinia panamericana UAMH 10762]EMC95557.1 hypothetical protein BAUCODRAFT_493774 [Baudoinia panamericana UAMH 10762]